MLSKNSLNAKAWIFMPRINLFLIGKNVFIVIVPIVINKDVFDPLEKEMATYSSILAWKIPWTEEPGRLWSRGVAKSRTQLS